MADNEELLSQLIETGADEDTIKEVINQITEKVPLQEYNEIQEIDFYNAYENIPEFFIPVNMLYIPLKVNQREVKAFVDTGAAITIINRKIAERCNLINRINQKYTTNLIGVGKSKTLGKIFNLDLEIGGFIIEVVVSVVENGPDFLIGLDTLKNHKLIVDLAKNCLRNDHFEVPFIIIKREGETGFEAM